MSLALAFVLAAAIRLAPAPLLVPMLAQQAGVDPQLACCIVKAESAWNPYAVGDLGERGLWQIHPDTWAFAREKMGAEANFALAFDPYENTQTALWLVGQGYLDWWSTYPMCK